MKQGVRAKHVIADKILNSLVWHLNIGMVLKVKIPGYERLSIASLEQLDTWKLTGKGIVHANLNNYQY